MLRKMSHREERKSNMRCEAVSEPWKFQDLPGVGTAGFPPEILRSSGQFIYQL